MSLIHSNIEEPTQPHDQDISPSSAEQSPKHVVIMGAGPAGLTAAYELVYINK